jgi:hypothetical protein
MKRSTVSITFSIFLAVGLLLLVISGIIWYNKKKFETKSVKTTGTVIDLIAKSSSSGSQPTYSPVINYLDAYGVKHRYIARYSSNPPEYKIGERVTIYYDLKNPDNANAAGWGEYLGVIIAGGLGLVFSLLGGIYFGISTLRRRRNGRLKQSGQLIRADVVAVDVNNAISVNRRHPWFIRCDWKDPLTGKKNSFKSGFIWTDPTPLIDTHKKIDVYLDPNNPRKYYVDITAFEV